MSRSTRGSLAPKTTGHAAWPVDSWTGPLLLVRLSSLGDLVLATSTLELIHKRRPELAIDVLTRRPYAPVLHGLEAIGRVLLDDASSNGARGCASTQKSSAAPYATVLDLQGGQKGRRAGRRWAPGARHITYDRASLQRRLLVLCGRRMKGPAPLVVRFARAVAGGALDTTALQPKVAVEVHRQRVIVASLNTPSQPKMGWALLAPSASRPLKAIPAGLAGALQEGLLKRGWGVIKLLPPTAPLVEVAEGRTEGTLWATLAGRDREPVRTFSGALPDVIALLASVGVVISSDSGILHLATAVRTPAMGLFGPTVPELGFSPLGRSLAVGVDLACRPCHIHGPHRCWLRHERCWRDMQPETILDAVAELSTAAPHATG